jgi:hypothetical protein
MAKSRAHQNPDGSDDPNQRAGRWTRVCAWDGHELRDMDYVQVSDHERVCRFHYPQFIFWVEDTSQRMYRAEGAEEDDGKRSAGRMPV